MELRTRSRVVDAASYRQQFGWLCWLVGLWRECI
jgi:hypothetical protein